MDYSPPGSSAIGCPRQEYCSGLPFPSPRDLPYPGIECTSLGFPTLQVDSFSAEPPGKPRSISDVYCIAVMLRAWPLCTGAELNLRNRVLDEVEKDSFIILPGKRGHSGLLLGKAVCPPLGGLGKEFSNNTSPRLGLLTRLGCVQVICLL